MALQFSRGCPFDCEFCDITKLFGRKPRTKTNDQILAEFDLLYGLGWRGSLFLVDDNFIGNKRAALSLLTDVARWQKKRDYPFSLFTEASVNLGRLEPLMDAMIDSGFTTVFLGIETPNREALLKTQKEAEHPNRRRTLPHECGTEDSAKRDGGDGRIHPGAGWGQRARLQFPD